MRTYVSLCDSAGLQPFVGLADPNIAIRNFLVKRRRLYVRYIDKTKFMSHVRIRKIERDAYLTSYGFAIRIEGWVDPKADPLWFRKIETVPGWRFAIQWDDEHRFTTKLDPGITVYVRNPVPSSPVSWYVGYEIHCPIVPVLQNFKSETILTSLWDSTSIAIRPKNTVPQRRI